MVTVTYYGQPEHILSPPLSMEFSILFHALIAISVQVGGLPSISLSTPRLNICSDLLPVSRLGIIQPMVHPNLLLRPESRAARVQHRALRRPGKVPGLQPPHERAEMGGDRGGHDEPGRRYHYYGFAGLLSVGHEEHAVQAVSGFDPAAREEVEC